MHPWDESLIHRRAHHRMTAHTASHCGANCAPSGTKYPQHFPNVFQMFFVNGQTPVRDIPSLRVYGLADVNTRIGDVWLLGGDYGAA